jgi:FkbM family methyltransferase
MTTTAAIDQPLLRRWRQAINRSLGAFLVNKHVGAALEIIFPNRLRVHGVLIDVRSPMITRTTKAALFFGTYESAETRLVRKYLPRDLDVVELGASLGVVTCVVRRHISLGRRLISVEANPRLAELARANLLLNGCEENVDVLSLAISTCSDEVEFVVGEASDSGRVGLRAEEGGKILRVPAESLSKLLARHRVSNFCLICDIEGTEWELWRHDYDGLCRASMVVMETHDNPRYGSHDDLIAELANDPSFELVDRYGPVVVLRNRTPASFPRA